MSTRQVVPIDAGSSIEVRGPDGRTLRLRLAGSHRRNYSITARATSDDGTTLFVKQFVDRRGRALTDVYRGELHGMRAGETLFSGVVRVPSTIGIDDDRLVIAYEWLDTEPLDETIRRDRKEFARRLPRFLDAADGMARAAATPGAVSAALPDVDPTAVEAVCFKGLEIRNLAMTPQGEVVAFDLGRPFPGTRAEQVARLVVSVALLHWGRPLRLFAAGPPVDAVATAEERFRDDLDMALLRRRARRELRNRVEDGQAGSAALALVRSFAIRSLGSLYVRRLERRWAMQPDQRREVR